MEYREFRAKTVNDAVTEALIELEITSDMIEYEVIEEGSTGLLGLFSKDAVIRARRKEDSGEEEDIFDIKAEIRAGSLLDPEPVKADRRPEKAFQKKETGRPEKAFQKKEESKSEKAASKKEESKAEKAVPKKEESKPAGAFRREKNKAGGEEAAGQTKDPAKKTEAEAPVKAELKPENKPAKAPAVVKDVDEEVLKRVLNEILDKLEIRADIEIKVNKEERTVDINVEGDDTGDIIGKRGQTLDAIQYILSILVNKEQECYFRVKLDTGNYRERRQKTLENLAKNMASKVKKTRRKVALEPMNPYERRVIHSYLQSDKLVTTKSEGEEPNRRVVIYYKKS